MSELHKTFLKRIKEQESALGLSGLANDDSFMAPPTKSVPITPKQQTPEDGKILQDFQEFKSKTFTEEFYETEQGDKFKTYYRPSATSGPVVFCQHGAGSSSMTFANLVKHIKDESLGIFLFDMRGHGESKASDDFSIDVLVEDTHFVLETFIKKYQPTSIFLLGHSLGGAISAKYANVHTNDLIKGLILLDIVEEAAVQSLNAMPSFISKRPRQFPSISRAIQWHMNFLLFNQESTKLSIPDLFNKDLKWITDLNVTRPYWDSWFTGLSDNFMNFKGAKLLILSTHESLDKRLMIGQMQGKFQLVIISSESLHSKNL
ncbi:hypothetical protein G210_5502 [Candida maltosa Xu316]|uniref:Protein phosphatase methylesterase 1 n=1 Tax=Candida maltosa (strain Xu316) TaxID=1245528 RepID=M3K7Z3_CANMX|nr:hypothetical protein G210_5502 [Candida maltosa Xu316]